MFDLSNKVALVTGASGGLGGDISRFLHKQGATVIVSGTNMANLEKLSEELRDRIHVLPCQLSNLEAVDQLAKDAEAITGSIDILVNNAGITCDGLMMRMKDEDWDKVLLINLTAVFRLTRGLLRGMLKNQFGRIINISSIVGATGNAGQVNYAASKAGLFGFTKSLALECATRNITVNCIAPGFIKTPMTDCLTDSQKERVLSAIPLKRMGTGVDIASGVVYLASDEAAYITGQVLHINGGMAMF